MGKAKTMGQITAERLRAERTRQGLTQQDLADRLNSLGQTVDRTTIAKIEKGGSRANNLGLQEAFAIAAALSVPPAVLFFGLGFEDRVTIAPGMTVHPDLAAKWLEGLEGPATSRRFAWKPGEWREAALPVFLYHNLRAAQTDVQAAWARLRAAEYAGTKQEQREARRAEVESLRTLSEALKAMKKHGVRAPKMHPETAAKLRQLGLEP
jgi:transcriptional regulator with XRE-family HTH domain